MKLLKTLSIAALMGSVALSASAAVYQAKLEQVPASPCGDEPVYRMVEGKGGIAIKLTEVKPSTSTAQGHSRTGGVVGTQGSLYCMERRSTDGSILLTPAVSTLPAEATGYLQ